MAVQHDGSDKDVDCANQSVPKFLPSPGGRSNRLTDTPAEEREEEGRIAVDVVRDVGQELKATDNCAALAFLRSHMSPMHLMAAILGRRSQKLTETENNDIGAHDDGAHGWREELGDTTQDHDHADGDVDNPASKGQWICDAWCPAIRTTYKMLEKSILIGCSRQGCVVCLDG